ncbi:MAG: hypothetical protein CM15mV47_780 [uncultured marine virus]|nr:MAG: hypothetical protein CM15mV47_780 [uncultured marine virus]
MEALDGLGDTGVGIEEPETITDLTKPTDILEGGRDESDRGTFDSVGIDFGNPKDLSFDYSGGTTSFDSYSDYLKTNADMYDRVPLTEFLWSLF